MFLQVLLQRVLLGDDPGVVIVVDAVVAVVQVVVVGVGDGGVRLALAILHVVQLLVGEVVEGEVARRAGRVHRPALPRRKTQHRAHVRCCSGLLAHLTTRTWSRRARRLQCWPRGRSFGAAEAPALCLLATP